MQEDNHRSIRSSHFSRIAPTLAAIFLTIAGGGCGPEMHARSSLRQGDAARAVRLFEQAVTQRPDDPALVEELTEARRTAGEVMAHRAHDALARGDHADAVRFAREAAQFDPAHRELEQHARQSWADQFLAQAEHSLAEHRYEEARAIVEKAQTAAHAYAAPAAALRRIDEVEAAQRREDALAFTRAGQFDRAMTAARRAASLRPDDAAHAELPADVRRAQDESAFDRLALAARDDLTAGRLESVKSRLAEMANFGVRAQQFKQFESLLREQEAKVQAALDAAREARAHGRFSESLRQYDLAQRLAADRAAIDDERRGALAEQQSADLRERGIRAHDEGDFMHAIALFKEALSLRADEDLADLLREARAAHHRLAHEQAMAEGNLLGAIEHLAALALFEPDRDRAVRLEQLRRELAERSLTEASRLHAAGRTEAAVAVLDRASKQSGDARLSHRRVDLAAESLVQQAVAAEQAGRFAQARNLYLQAMSRGGERQAIASRIDDVQILADMQTEVEMAQRESASLLAQSRDRQRDLNALRQDFERQRYEYDMLARAAGGLEHDLDRERRNNHNLQLHLRQMQYEIDRLRREAHDHRRDAATWRRRYQQERRRNPS